MNILGQYAARRALEIAAFGKHSALLIGPPGCGKSLLIAEFRSLCDSKIGDGDNILRAACIDWEESHPCPCGFLNDSVLPCFCTEPAIALFGSDLRKKSEQTDIVIEVPSVPRCDLTRISKTETLESVRARLKNAPQIKNISSVDAVSDKIFENWAVKTGATARQWVSVHKVACTIACLDGKDCIESRHAAEAIQYKSFQGI